jgi:hypothetical protein
MSKTLLSIYTLYNWDNTIFDRMKTPVEMDKDLIIDNILLELSELEILYNDPDFMKFAIERWSMKEVAKWEKLYATTLLEYNPIENYNRTEDTTVLETRDLATTDNETRNLAQTSNETRDLESADIETRNLGISDLETRNLTSQGTENNTTTGTDAGTGTDTNLTEVVGFNNADLTTKQKDTTTLGTIKTASATSETTLGGSDTGTVAKAISDTGTIDKDSTEKGTIDKVNSDTGTIAKATSDTGTVSNTTTSNAYGNIGVTTTQQMIDQERNILEFNMYNYIVNSFKMRFCITVY